jgi:hypothetical protein
MDVRFETTLMDSDAIASFPGDQFSYMPQQVVPRYMELLLILCGCFEIEELGLPFA